MNPEARGVPKSAAAFLESCLVDGDSEQHQREEKLRRRAIFLSVLLQAAALAALIVFPLLSKGERLPVKLFVQFPPYRLGARDPHPGNAKPIPKHTSQPCLFCNHPRTASRPTRPESAAPTTADPGDPIGRGDPPGDRDGVPNGLEPPPAAPRPPSAAVVQPVETPRRVTVGHIDPAYLTRRIEPHYPIIGIQLHRETRVELHAVIATDGSIQSLQVLSGDPLFYPSALEAVRDWHYSPTVLNGRAVEVDTHITVIYSLNR